MSFKLQQQVRRGHNIKYNMDCVIQGIWPVWDSENNKQLVCWGDHKQVFKGKEDIHICVVERNSGEH